MIGTVLVFLSSAQTVKPSVPGMVTSSSTRSQGLSANRASKASPVSNSSVPYQSLSRNVLMILRIFPSSSAR